MSVTCARSTILTYTGDVVGVETIAAAVNTASAGYMTIVPLATGFNAVLVPTAGATPVAILVTAVTIVPPAGNTNTLTLKGVTGDTGIPLHLTDPTTIALASSATQVGITVGTAITNVRFYWS